MTPFQKLVLRALSILVWSAIWHNAYGTDSNWNSAAQKIKRELDEAGQ